VVSFPSVSPTKTLYTPLLSPIRAVTTAWRVFGLQIKERPPDIKGSCEYIKYTVADYRQYSILRVGRGVNNFLPQKIPHYETFHKACQYVYCNNKQRLLYHLQLTKYLTPLSRVLLEKLTGSKLVKNFPVFYVTRRTIIAFTTDRHPSLF
jgi:hypothetical protein